MKTARREFRRFYNLGRHGVVSSKHAIKCWINNFKEIESALKKKPTGRPRKACTPQNVDVVREFVLRSPQHLIRKQAAAVIMLQSFVKPELNNFPHVQETWFQQDKAILHTARQSLNAVLEFFGNRVISRFGNVLWLPGWPNLSISNFFL